MTELEVVAYHTFFASNSPKFYGGEMKWQNLALIFDHSRLWVVVVSK